MRAWLSLGRGLGLRPVRRHHYLAMALWAAIAAAASAAQITGEWIGTGYGDWTDPANWANGVVPVNSLTDQYNVILNPPTSDYTQTTLSAPMSVSQLTLGDVLYVYDATGQARSSLTSATVSTKWEGH